MAAVRLREIRERKGNPVLLVVHAQQLAPRGGLVGVHHGVELLRALVPISK